MARRKKGKLIHGWINFYKPKDMGSTDAVGKIRWLFDAQKAGHAGTLDPLAEGILPIALGEATKTIPYIQDTKKTYSFDLIWGEARNTDDAEGNVIETSDHRPTQQEIIDILPKFSGEIQQTPPIFSAIKVNGERAYNIARRGGEVEMQPRQIFIENIRLIEHKQDETRFEVTCGKGTYIRSLGRDIAKKLGGCGYIDNLKRIEVGHFHEKTSIFLDKLEDLRHKNALDEALLSVDTGLDDILVLELTDNEASKLKQGQFLSFISKADFNRVKDLNEKTARAYCKNTFLGFVDINKATVKAKKLLNL